MNKKIIACGILLAAVFASNPLLAQEKAIEKSNLGVYRVSPTKITDLMHQPDRYIKLRRCSPYGQ